MRRSGRLSTHPLSQSHEPSLLLRAQMWKTVYQPRGPRVWLMNVINVVMGLVAIAAVIGSVETIVASATKFKPFTSTGSGHG